MSDAYSDVLDKCNARQPEPSLQVQVMRDGSKSEVSTDFQHKQIFSNDRTQKQVKDRDSEEKLRYQRLRNARFGRRLLQQVFSGEPHHALPARLVSAIRVCVPFSLP